jgi:hypothetical protein
MKRSILLAIAIAVMLSVILQSCGNTLNKAQINVRENPNEMIEASTAYLRDIEQYRKETAATIELNCQKIFAFKSRVDLEKESSKSHYRHSVFELELYNSYMKKKLDDYKPEGKESWEIFKEEYTRQMNDLGTEFANFDAAI